ncbi:MAG: ribulose-phosphate 3-epimerase [Deltaproteobacteria bacterium]|nr:ribulose-phosphate 3-epimerase [Deltaproteobacteria bacterium]
MKKIAPSILSADFGRLAEEIQAVEKAGADLIHLDIMDGHFVPNITAGPILVEVARRATKLPLDAHLMIENPEKYVEAFAKAGANSISVHYEACRDLPKTLALIAKHGARRAVAINPDTPVSSILSVLNQVEMVLVMTVHPGWAGQGFIPSCLEKVKELNRLVKDLALTLDIEVDGGIKTSNIGDNAAAGANVFVAGSAIFKSANYAETIKAMRTELSGQQIG